MSRAPRILGPDGRPYRHPPAARPTRRVAEYDAARTTDDNRRHWAYADSLSARSTNSLEVRRILRERARYESANNSYCRGMVLTRANDLVGTGPRPQLAGDGSATDAPRRIERAFNEWSRSIRLAEKLRIMVQAKTVDGEPFAILTTNDALPTPVRLDLQLAECDRFTSPWGEQVDSSVVDGIRFDAGGNPVAYYCLDEHPGDLYSWSPRGRWLPARNVIHWFRADRPGQIRGVPEITPALPLFAQLRRFTLATLTAAETAADHAAVLQTEGPAYEGEEDDADAWEAVEIERGMFVRLPRGAKLGQLDPKHPSTTYEMFVRLVIREAARCLDMPLNKALGDSSGFNYSSGRLDHQVYFRSLQVERSHCEAVILDRVFAAWLDEAVMIPGYLPRNLDLGSLEPRWFWDGWSHVDPAKEAQADQVRLDSLTVTLAEVYAERGQDWEDALRQRAREEELIRELGIRRGSEKAQADQSAQEEKEYAADA